MLEKTYIKYFLSGYIIRVYTEELEYSHLSKKDYSVRSLLVYLGLSDRYIGIVRPFSVVLPACDLVLSLILLLYKFIVCVCLWLFSAPPKSQYKRLFVNLNMAVGKIDNLNKAIPDNEYTYLSIPFISNKKNKERYVKVIDIVTIKSIIRSLFLSIRTSCFMFYKYKERSLMFRAHSSFEFYLTCFFVDKVSPNVSFVYYSTIDRWAYLLSNDCKHSNILIQHGILTDIPFIKMKAPKTVYYVNRDQQHILEKRLFNTRPDHVFYRPILQFSGNEKLLSNEKNNILIICCPKFLNKEIEVIDSISLSRKYNIYVKTHPGFSNNQRYDELQKQYNFVLLERNDYPKVDLVISYESTLAIEYADVGIEVYKYNDPDFTTKINGLIK